MKVNEDVDFDTVEDELPTDVNEEEEEAEEEILDLEANNDPFNNDDIITPGWPQSYKQSMDMYTSVSPPSIEFLRRLGQTGVISTNPSNDHDSSSLRKPLIVSDSNSNKERSISTISTEKLSVSPYSKFSNRNEHLPPPKQQSSFSQALLNGINVLCGIGLLTTPYAVREGGWLSLSLLVMFCSMACYTGILLKRCLETNSGLQTYPDIGQAAFGSPGRLTIAIVLYLELYGTCVEFITMISDSLTSLFPNTSTSFDGLIHLDSHQIFAISAALLILPTVWLKNLSLLSYFSVGGVVASILVALCLLWVGIVNKVGFDSSGTALDFANLSATIGIYGYAFSGHSVFPNIYTSMKEPSRFPYVLVTSFLFCLFLYIGVAVCAFLMFGDSIESQFTLSMPRELVASKIAVWTMVVNPMTKYALTITPVTLSLEELLPLELRESYFTSVFVRTSLVLSTLVVALTVPLFASVMALLGSLFAMLVSFIFPCACYLSLFKGRLTKFQIAGCVSIVIVAMICCCLGTYSAIGRLLVAQK